MSNTDAGPRWPRTLYGRLVLVLVAGMLGAQLLTGTIWFDKRYDRVQEIPARLAGARVAQALRTLDAHPDLMAELSAGDFRITPLAAVPPVGVRLNHEQRETGRIVADAATRQAGTPVDVRLRDVHLFDDANREGTHLAMVTAEHPHSAYVIDAKTTDGRWFRFDVTEGQAGLQQRPGEAFREYAWRIYGLRTILILLLALLLVRWITRPLTHLSQAAKALGRDLRAPPLALTGPNEVRAATGAFNQMQQRLARALDERDELLAAVSHDLRTPITRMRLRTEMMLPGPQREALRDELAQMQELVDSVLGYLAAGASPGPLQQVDLGALALALCEDQRDMGNDVACLVEGGSTVAGETSGMRRALTNLVDNAVRHGHRARVLVRGVDVTIDDDGPGIPDGAMAHVLQPYFRLERSRRSGVHGTGLGLSIARQLLTAQGATLRLANARGAHGVEGLRVTVHFQPWQDD
jgi:signal transduction histidine kinase